jgi:hypothetical protein
MKPRCVVQAAALSAVATMGIACLQIDGRSNCQLYAPDEKWVRAGIHVVMQAPSEVQCPLSLTHYGMSQSYLAHIDAPAGTPLVKPLGVPQVNTTIWDVNGLQSGYSLGLFGFGTDLREHANDEGFYYAGRGGATTTALQQDQADTYIELSPSAGGGVATSTVFLPYTCCPYSTLVSGLPKIRRGTTVTIRTWTSYTMPKWHWYINGVEQLVSTGLTNPVPPGAKYSKTMNTPGTFAWKIVISGSRPGESKTLQFKMLVQ